MSSGEGRKTKAAEWAAKSRQNVWYPEWLKGYRASVSGRASSMLNKAKTRCKRNGLPCTITREWIIERLVEPCPLTGRQFDMTVGSGRRSPDAPSLDRIDPRLGYTPENTRVIVTHANLALSNFQDEELIRLAKDILGRLAAKHSESCEGSTIREQSRRAKRLEMRGVSPETVT